MRSGTLCLLVFAISSSSFAHAQTRTTLPAGYEGSLNGGWGAYLIGRAPAGRYQLAEGGFPFPKNAKKVELLAVDYRLDANRNHALSDGIGRSWTKVTLSMAETDISKFGMYWSKNVQSSPTVVYQATTRWPSVVGVVTSPKWGQHVAFPFKTPWAYFGNNALLFDYVFEGGKLGNNAVWQSWRRYYLDTVATFSSHQIPQETVPPASGSGPGPCGGAEAISQLWAWGPKSAWPNTISGRFAGLNIASGTSTPVIFGLSVLGNRSGLNIGARCHKLHLNTAAIVATLPATNRVGGARIPFGHTPFNTAWAGLNLWLQAAWNDKQGFSMTRAAHVELDRIHDELPRRFAAGSVSGSSATSLGSNSTHHPMPRISWK